MSFIRSFVRVDRWLDWKLVMPVYDGRQCPECGSCVVGRRGQKAHQEWHTRRTEWDSHLREAIRRALVKIGLNPVELAPDNAPDGLYDVEDQDERLTRKARMVAELDDYDDEEECDDV